MNIQNVVSLTEMLNRLGFANAGSALIKRICFKPASFQLAERIQKDGDVICYTISFAKADDVYQLKYYEASLRKAVPIPESARVLDQKMATIDWKIAFDMKLSKTWAADDPGSWKAEAQVEVVMAELEALGDAEEASKLKLKYWADIDQDVFNLSSIRSKYEVVQRFYFFEDQGCIGAEEAYRFLHNKWMEKQMIARRKQTEETGASSKDKGASGSGKLLQKKRPGNRKKNGLIS